MKANLLNGTVSEVETKAVTANIAVEVVEQAAEEVETLQASVKAGTIAQIVVAVIAIIGLIYLLKLVLVTVLVSMLIAYVLESPVVLLTRWHIPRWVGSFSVVTFGLILVLGLTYFSYNRALDFADALPQYSATLRNTLAEVRSRADKLAEQARSVVEAPKERQKPLPVRIEQTHGVTQLITENSGTLLESFMAISFVPFLVYFMLASKDHVHVSTVRLFPKEHRLLAHRTVGNISVMIRSYILANVAVGLGNAIVCGVVFWYLGIQYFYFVGVISGFATLVPYLGVFLALLPPLAGGLGSLHRSGLLAIIVTVIGMHVVTMNLVYPRVIGARLQLNPLAVSLSLLFWAWIWGAPGLILAIPLLGAFKIICDHVDPLQGLGCWLGDSIKTR